MKRMWPLALLAVTACDDMPQARTESEIRAIAEDVADDVAAARASELETRIAELETKIESLESENEALKSRVSSTETDDQWAEDSIDSLFRNDRMFAQRLQIPVATQ